jgi:hypothetical protein
LSGRCLRIYIIIAQASKLEELRKNTKILSTKYTIGFSAPVNPLEETNAEYDH